ncbi:segregation/condensation protein A [Methanocella sp. CWC-04]|uniref:Segregation/condensation protein A n=2 Tax=Methanooceanicella nereidis TaxID=2052831 RepID=A0AAP2RAQ5_9EURY|nr:ScpA family protein [Methanocella sp. CWC-04]MCD1293694.1 segregation/condensation protein A [Methanocella sp. CWC-04]
MEQSVEILLEMARGGEIDPWNINIIDVTDKFLKKLTEMEKLDLRVSARTLLYASILLRMKSDILVNVPPPEPFEEDDPFLDMAEDDYPVLEPRLRHVASRPVTLQELIDELKRAVATKDIPALRQARKVEKPRRKTLEEVLGIAHEEDIEKSIVEMIKVLDAEYAYRDFVTMSELVKEKTPRGIIDVYLPLLFLANRKYVTLTQEILFDEIFIRRGDKLG